MATNILLGYCAQRAYRQQQPAPVRTELQPSPYPTFTEYQLNMRRKVEILKYIPTNMSTQTNTETKTQYWSKIAQSNVRRKICTINDNISVPTSSSNVPGPVIDLYYDPTVPLYNYAVKVDPPGNDTKNTV
jgi:hypothetical protein